MKELNLACSHTEGKHTPVGDQRCEKCKAGPFAPLKAFAQAFWLKRMTYRNAIEVRRESRKIASEIRRKDAIS